VGDVFRRQIVDLPEGIVPVVTEYQYPKLVCPCCQKGTRAALRPEHEHEIGERLTAAISYLIVSRKTSAWAALTRSEKERRPYPRIS
jgi:zinc-finger binding domain of transposase IS66